MSLKEYIVKTVKSCDYHPELPDFKCRANDESEAIALLQNVFHIASPESQFYRHEVYPVSQRKLPVN